MSPGQLLASLSALTLVIGGCAPPSVPATPAAQKTIRTPSGIEMALLPAGEFTMGDDRGEDDEQPAQRVTIDAFYIDVCEVTQASFQATLGRNPSKFVGPDQPAERVSWLAAVQYCNMRSTREGLRPCYDLQTFACDFSAAGYRLPTEAEWEYACRAESVTRWTFADDPGQLAQHAWFKGNSGKITHPVRQKVPNAWGLYDMLGNVAEWCNDYYAEKYAAGAASANPRGPATGKERVLRGGSWSAGADACRAAARQSAAPGLADVCFGYEAYGFRCVRKADSAPRSAR